MEILILPKKRNSPLFQVLYLSLLIAFPVMCLAQANSYQLRTDIPFQLSSGQTLEMPLTGGLAMPQPSDYDLDMDGTDDLIVFDRIGNKILPFLRDEFGKFVYAPQYESLFPNMTNFALFLDFDQDGIRDIFTSVTRQGALAEVLVYKGAIKNGQQTFESFYYTVDDPSFTTFIESHNFDIPSFSDMNGDGDLDLLLFPSSGNHISYYENQSIENGHGLDSLQFKLYNNCWGNLGYDLDELILNACQDSVRSGGSSPRSTGCLGSLLLAIDSDGDSDKDMLYSTLTDTKFSLLLQENERVFENDRTYLLDDVEELPFFPAAFWTDVNQDRLPDLCVASNRIAEVLTGSTADRFLYYLNTGTAAQPAFELQQEDFLVDQMLDQGFRSSIATLDYNRDGLKDIVVAGNYGDPFYTYVSRLNLYENIGTVTEPAFQLVDSDYGNLGQYNLKAIHPTFGDVNGDGDVDLIIGTYLGNLEYFENISASNREPVFQFRPNSFEGFKVSFYARPQLVDLDGDRQKDLIVGSSRGPITTLINRSTLSDLDFEAAAKPLTGLYENQFNIESCPYVYPSDSETGLSMLVGIRNGRLHYYPNFRTDGDDPMILRNSFYGEVDAGSSSTICMEDIDGDGQAEILVGNERGGLNILDAPLRTAVQQVEWAAPQFAISPNPSSDYIKVDIKSLINEEITLYLIDSYGRKALSQHFPHPTNIPLHIDTSALPAGIYICNISSKSTQMSQMLVLY
ncbi:MAG: FG-GAP-like repeat-containing protein [Bacteroidota bacterium]